jgi:hypothetical protein
MPMEILSSRTFLNSMHFVSPFFHASEEVEARSEPGGATATVPNRDRINRRLAPHAAAGSLCAAAPSGLAVAAEVTRRRSFDGKIRLAPAATILESAVVAPFSTYLLALLTSSACHSPVIVLLNPRADSDRCSRAMADAL